MKAEMYTAQYVGYQDGLHVWNVFGPQLDRLVNHSDYSIAKIRAICLAEDLNIAYAAGRDAK